MRRSRSLVVVALLMPLGAAQTRAAEGPSPARVVALEGDLEDLVADGTDVRTLVERRPPSGSTIFSARVGATGPLEPLMPFFDLPVNADLQAARVLPSGGTFTVYNTRGDGYVGNELLGVVDSSSGHSEQRLNPPSTQASSVFYDSIAVGPTGTLAVPFTETTLPTGTEKFSNYSIAVRPAGAATFHTSEPIFPRGAQGYDVMEGATYLGPDGGGWVFLLPSGDDWRSGEPVVVLARRIEPSGELGVLLHLRVPVKRPVNTDVSMAAKFDARGRLIAVFASSGYGSHSDERAVVWSHTLEPSTITNPPRSVVVDRRGGYGQNDNVDVQLDERGRATVIAQSERGLRLFHQRGARWTPGPLLTSGNTFTSRLVRLASGRSVAIWLQTYNRSQDRSDLMVATGKPTARRWPTHRVRGLGRPGLVRLDAVTAFGNDRLAAAVYARDERLVLTQIGR